MAVSGFKPGNQIWKMAKNAGRKKIFDKPSVLWTEATKYFDWCDKNPLVEDNIELVKVNGVGDKVTRVPIYKVRAYTISGLAIFLGVNTKYLYDFEDGIKKMEDQILAAEFSEVCTRIRDVIYTQKFEAAAAGMLKENIIARDLGLADKNNVVVQNEQPLLGDEIE